jgi:hypothetical protein
LCTLKVEDEVSKSVPSKQVISESRKNGEVERGDGLSSDDQHSSDTETEVK